MPRPVTVIIPHQLGRAEARQRVEASMGRFKEQLAGAGLGKVQHAWAGDSLNLSAEALGQSVTGSIDVRDTELHIEVMLPGLLAGFAEKVAGKLRREGQLMIEKN